MGFFLQLLVLVGIILAGMFIVVAISKIVEIVSVLVEFIVKAFPKVFIAFIILLVTYSFFGDEVEKFFTYVFSIIETEQEASDIPEPEGKTPGPVIETGPEEINPPVDADEHDHYYTDKKGHTYYYDIFIEDVTWQEAEEKAAEHHGYLVVFNTQEEFKSVTSKLADNGYQDIKFYIGGRRDSSADSREYYWVDSDGAAYSDEILNGSKYDWLWMKDEPSYHDGAIVEDVMDVYYYSADKKWVCNDATDDIIGQYNRAGMIDYSDKIGYIIEYPLG